MSLHDDQVTLQQMLDSARKVLYLAARRSRPDLDDDWVATLALMQLLQIIGEAARRLSDSTRQQHPQVRWARFGSLGFETGSFMVTTRLTLIGFGRF